MQATGEAANSGIGMLMNLRKCANHPLLIRDQYDDHKLEVGESDIAVRKTEQNMFQVMARLLKTRDSGHKQALESYIVEDLKIMSDFEINKTCETYRVRISFISIRFREILSTISVYRAFESRQPHHRRVWEVQITGRHAADDAE